MSLFDRLFRRPKLFSLHPSDLQMWEKMPQVPFVDVCACFQQTGDPDGRVHPPLYFHREEQDTAGEAWKMLESLIDSAAANGSEEFVPALEVPPELWVQIVTLPPSIAKLKRAKRLYLYGSHLVRIPPEIGELTQLEELDLYSSYRLHWLPYEVTRCKKIRASRFSTRSLYGNYKYRAPFPDLTSGTPESLVPLECSVCRHPIERSNIKQVWISRWVGKDVLPLLVNACSPACIASLPAPANGYVSKPHQGGANLVQPPPDSRRPRR